MWRGCLVAGDEEGRLPPSPDGGEPHQPPGGAGTGWGADRLREGGLVLHPRGAPREGKPVTSPVGPVANDITRRARSQAHQAIYGIGWRPDAAAPELFQMWLGQSLQLPASPGQADEEGRGCWGWEGPSEPPRGLGHRSLGHHASPSRGLPVHRSPGAGPCGPPPQGHSLELRDQRGSEKIPRGGSQDLCVCTRGYGPAGLAAGCASLSLVDPPSPPCMWCPE